MTNRKTRNSTEIGTLTQFPQDHGPGKYLYGRPRTAAQGPPPRDDGDDGKKDEKKEDPKKFKNKTPSPRKKGKARQGNKGATPQQILNRDRTGKSIIAVVKQEIRWSFEQKGLVPHGPHFNQMLLREVLNQLERHWDQTNTEALQ